MHRNSFSWVFNNFFKMQNSKFAKLFNICWKHITFMLCRNSQFQQMLNNFANFEFCSLKKKNISLAHEELVNIYRESMASKNLLMVPFMCRICHLCSKMRSWEAQDCRSLINREAWINSGGGTTLPIYYLKNAQEGLNLCLLKTNQ